jgi:hypothetical protein
MDEDLTMLIGPASDGALLEIGVLDLEGDDPVIIHAMPQLYVLFNALETEAHRLGDLVNAAQPQTRRGSLFARADRSAVELEARVSTTLRITRGNLRVLDRLVTEHEAKDRSQLITAVLQAHFTDD